jgi:hypothetical protein
MQTTAVLETEDPGSNPAGVEGFLGKNIARLLCILDLICTVSVLK